MEFSHREHRDAKHPGNNLLQKVFPSSCRGGILVLVLGMISIMLIMGMTFIAVKGFEQKIGLNHKDSIQAQYIAEAGVAQAIQALKMDNLWSGSIGPIEHFGGKFTVTVSDSYDTTTAIITSIGEYGIAMKKIILSAEYKAAESPPTDQEIAYHLAEVGVQMVLDILEIDYQWRGTIGPMDYEGGTITVTCVTDYGNKVKITSTGQYGSAEETIEVIVKVKKPKKPKITKDETKFPQMIE